MADILDHGNADPVTLDSGDGGSVSLPEGFPLAESEFQASGNDLVITSPDGQQVTVQDYFSQEHPPQLATPDGAEVSGDMVVQLSGGSDASVVGGSQGDALAAGTDDAGAGTASHGSGVIGGTDGEPIGSVENVAGTVFAVRTDGTRVELHQGDSVFQGDVLESGPDGAVGILLADETTFSMGESGRMVLDEMIYDPGTQEGSVSLSVLQGVFTFVSGQVAKTDPDAMTLDTPVATIGIRGTQVGIDIPKNGDMNVVLMEEADGFVGEVVVKNDGGAQVLNGANQLTVVRGYGIEPLALQLIDQGAMVNQFAIALEHLPLIHGNQNDFGLQSGSGEFLDEEIQQIPAGEQDAAALNNFDTAAGQETISAGTDNGSFTVQSGIQFNPLVGMVGGTPPGLFGGNGLVEMVGAPAGYDNLIIPAVITPDPASVPETVITGDQVIFGGAGNDIITGGSGNDLLVGGGGSDTIDGGAGNDVLVGGDLAAGFTVEVTAAGQVNAVAQNGSGSQALAESPADGSDVLFGGAGNDVLVGSTAADLMHGGAGNDILHGGSGNDVMVGGDGSDTMFGGDGNDIMFGDEVLAGYTGSFSAQDILSLMAQEGDGTGGGADLMSGGAGNDIMFGTADADTISGDAGNDSIFGGDGNDVLSGGAGDDFIHGGAGNDLIDGGTGRDIAAFSYTLDQSTVTIDGASGVITVTGPDGTDTLSNIEVLSFDGGVLVAPVLEDTAYQLDNARLFDGMAGAESVTISGIPDGAVLSAGTDNGDGSWTLSATADAGLDVILSGVTLTPPLNSKVDFTISVSAQMPSTQDGTGATVTGEVIAGGELTLMIQGVIDFTLNPDQSVASGLEDQPITLFDTASGADPQTDFGVDISTLDDAEALSVSITISNVPTGGGFSGSGVRADDSMMSALRADGTPVEFSRNGDGDFVVSGFNAADLASVMKTLTVTPPLNHGEDFTLQITAQVTDGGETSTTVVSKLVSVEAVADAPELSVGGVVSSLEDAGRIALNINAQNTDPSEILSISIEGVPDGVKVEIEYAPGQFVELASDGGVVTVPTQFMNSVFITPVADSNVDFTLTVNATSTEPGNNATATTSALISVDMTGVADAANLSTGNVTGAENTAIVLDLSASLNDVDGSETLSITISDIPAGSVLAVGSTVLGPVVNGAITLTPDQLTGLTITPPLNSEADFTLHVAATTTENDGDSTTVTGSIEVGVLGGADAPVLNLTDVSGGEDTAIALSIDAQLTDSSETLSISIGGIPAGSVLMSGNQVIAVSDAGVANLLPAQLSGLTITPPSDSNADFQLSVTATSTTTNGEFVDTTSSLNVVVAGVADAPTLTTTGASGTEDLAIALNISSALTDTDGSESLSITISDVPAGAVLSAGTDNGDGSWTLSAENLTGLSITPPLNFDGSFDLKVTATSTDVEAAGEPQFTDSNSVTGTLHVDVANVTGPPVLVLDDATGNEDTPIALNIDATAADGTELLSITISGIPDGAVLSAGTVVDGAVTLTPDQIAGLTITPPADSNVNFDLSITAMSRDGADVMNTTDVMNVDVKGVADVPSLNVAIGDGIVTDVTGKPGYGFGDQNHAHTGVTGDGGEGGGVGAVGTVFPLSIQSQLTDTDGSESLSISISGLPGNVELSAGTDNGDGSWTLSAQDLAGLNMFVPAGVGTDFNILVTSTSTDVEPAGEIAGSDTASISETLTIDMDTDAQAPTLAVADAAGNEDGSITLNIDAGLTDTDGSESLSITIAGVPDGATLSAGTDNGDGSWTLSAENLDGLTILPPENSNEDFNLSVTATSTEMASGNTATSTAVLNIGVTGVADTPGASVQNDSGAEDSWIQLHLDSQVTADTDGSETISIVISGVPDGALLNPGTNNGDGTWSATAAELPEVCILPPVNFSGDIQMSLRVTSTENDGDTNTVDLPFSVSIDGVADSPELVVDAVHGLEDTAISLDISAAVTDTSETLSITISDIPEGAVLSAGTVNNDGTVSLTADQLSGLTITPPANSNVDFNLTVTATSHDGDDANTKVVSLPVNLTGVADAPTIDVAVGEGVVIFGNGEESGGEASSEHALGSEFPLTIDATLNDTDGSETLSISVAGLPDGVTLSAGTQNSDGNWVLSAAQLAGVTMFVPNGVATDFSFSVTSTASENDGDTASSSVSFSLDGDDVAEAASLTVQDTTGFEDKAIALDIHAGLADTDGSETLSITVAGVPQGASLSAGTDNGDGNWTLSADQLDGLTITPASNSNDDFSLSVTATTIETSSGNTATTTSVLAVNVSGVADAPTLSVGIGDGVETGSSAVPVSHWKLDETGGNDKLIDAVGSHDGTPINKLRDMNTTRSGGEGGEGGGADPYGTAAGFKGGGNDVKDHEYIEVAHSAALKPAHGALTMWINPDDVGGSSSLASTDAAGADTQGGFNLRIVDGSLQFQIEDANGVHQVDGGSVAENQWSQVTVSWGENGMNLYLNGDLVGADNNYTGGLEGNLNPWTFGASQDASSDGAADNMSEFYNGHMDDIAIYDQQLGGDVITSLHENGVQATMVNSGQIEGVEFPLNITSNLTDTDGSESLSISVSGLPEGGSLSAGTDNGDGTWSLNPAQLSHLSMTVPADSSDFALNVSATSTENDGNTTTTTQAVQVDVASDGYTGTTDVLAGSDGMDVLFGSSGHDALVGGAGDDILSGGGGTDSFVFDSQSGHDIVTDLLKQDTLVFEGQEFHMDDLVLTENNEGSVVVSFQGVEGSSVTLDGVSRDDLDVNHDGNPSDGYSVTEDGGKVTITIDNVN